MPDLESWIEAWLPQLGRRSGTLKPCPKGVWVMSQIVS